MQSSDPPANSVAGCTICRLRRSAWQQHRAQAVVAGVTQRMLEEGVLTRVRGWAWELRKEVPGATDLDPSNALDASCIVEALMGLWLRERLAVGTGPKEWAGTAYAHMVRE